MKELRMVRVEWVDSAGLNKWQTRQACLDDGSVVVCVSIGFLLRSNRIEVTLVQSLADELGNVNGSFSIPRGCIKSIKRLT